LRAEFFDAPELHREQGIEHFAPDFPHIRRDWLIREANVDDARKRSQCVAMASFSSVVDTRSDLPRQWARRLAP
jgi:hypothetical protein